MITQDTPALQAEATICGVKKPCDFWLRVFEDGTWDGPFYYPGGLWRERLAYNSRTGASVAYRLRVCMKKPKGSYYVSRMP